MNEFKYTPGSWSRDKYGSIVDRNGESVRFRGVSTLCAGSEQAISEAEANTTLAAAAPDLLEAIEICLKAEYARREKLLPGAPATTYTQARIDKIEAAIAKALGEE